MTMQPNFNQWIGQFHILDKLSMDECNQLLALLNQQPWQREIFKGIPTKRKIKWWGIGTDGYQGHSHTWNDTPIDSEPLIAKLCERYHPQTNSVLAYEYPIGAGIGEHTDSGFHWLVIVINLIDCQCNLFGERWETIRFHHGGQVYRLGDGDVAVFDSRIPHSISPVKWKRYSIQLRVVEAEAATLWQEPADL